MLDPKAGITPEMYWTSGGTLLPCQTYVPEDPALPARDVSQMKPALCPMEVHQTNTAYTIQRSFIMLPGREKNQTRLDRKRRLAEDHIGPLHF